MDEESAGQNDTAMPTPPPTIIEQAQAAKKTDDDYQETDIFAWANNLFEFKEDLQIDLFLLNKNNVLYRAKYDARLQRQLQPLFIDGILDYVLEGAEQGMLVREFEDAEAEKGVLQRVRWKRVEKTREMMHWIKTQEHEIELFDDKEHDLKRIKGIVARCSHANMKQTFYIVKALPPAQMLSGNGAWLVQNKTVAPFDAAALRIPPDNQMMIIDQDLFVFNQAKLERLFDYNAKKNSIAEKKAAEIESRFRLSFADGLDLQSAIKGNKAIINKLQNIDLSDDIKQEQLIDHAEELGVEIMTDDNGAIIIMNTRDLSKFVNLLNDDYFESNLTGLRYEIRGKRILRSSNDEQML